MSFTWETMGEKSGPVVSIRYRENSLYGDSLYRESPVYKKKLYMECFSREPSPQKIPKLPWQNGHKVCCRRMGLNHEIFFISKSYREISFHHFGPFLN